MKCKYCGENIKFYKLPSGKQMPVETDQWFYKNRGKGQERLATFEGNGVRIISCTICVPDDPEVQGYGFMPHFANCKSYGKKERKEDGDQLRLF